MQTVAAVSENNDAQTITLTNSCPPWFVLRNNSAGRECSLCMCKEDFGDVVICDEKLQESYLLLGYCMTYNSSSSDEQESDAISFGCCPYVYYSNIVNGRYIALPHNISDLNNVFCAPLNRDGLLCRDCIDGFGPSVVTTGFTCMCKLYSQQLWVGAIHLIRICSCNSLLLCSSHTSSPYHICTNELLCHVQSVSGNCSEQGLNGRTR